MTGSDAEVRQRRIYENLHSLPQDRSDLALMKLRSLVAVEPKEKARVTRNYASAG